MESTQSLSRFSEIALENRHQSSAFGVNFAQKKHKAYIHSASESKRSKSVLFPNLYFSMHKDGRGSICRGVFRRKCSIERAINRRVQRTQRSRFLEGKSVSMYRKTTRHADCRSAIVTIGSEIRVSLRA